jgi:hypothetical protein
VTMDIFSTVILERTLESAQEAIASDPRVTECIETIRQHIDSPPDPNEKLQNALTELATIARLNGEFQIAARLEAFISRLST